MKSRRSKLERNVTHMEEKRNARGGDSSEGKSEILENLGID